MADQSRLIFCRSSLLLQKSELLLLLHLLKFVIAYLLSLLKLCDPLKLLLFVGEEGQHSIFVEFCFENKHFYNFYILHALQKPSRTFVF